MIPGPPIQPGHPIEYGDLFTFADYLRVIEQIAPEVSYDNAVTMFDAPCATGAISPFGMTEKGDWIYRFVPPEERLLRVVIYTKEA